MRLFFYTWQFAVEVPNSIKNRGGDFGSVRLITFPEAPMDTVGATADLRYQWGQYDAQANTAFRKISPPTVVAVKAMIRTAAEAISNPA